MTTYTKGNGQNDSACSSQSETTSLPPIKGLHALPHFPFDLVVGILCRLPVQHLLQLRCVCKSWNSLISRDSNFVKKHLHFSAFNHQRHHLIRLPTQFPNEFVLCHSPISSIYRSTSTTRVKEFSYSITEIPNKIIYDDGDSTVDGIVCFKLNVSLVVLCNPSIRKFKMLPPLKFPGQIFITYTLVYDRFINRYKIIALNLNTSSRKQVSIHTLGTNYWRRIQDFPAPDIVPRRGWGKFVNDSVNWLTCDSDCRAQYIVSLDLEKESYQKLSLPVFHDIDSYSTLGTLSGCLSFLCERDRFSDVWIMKEYGNEKSWIKILSVPPMVECDFYRYTKVLYISEDDKVLMEFIKKTKYSLVVYDSINNTFEIPKFENNILGQWDAHKVYVESLISPL